MTNEMSADQFNMLSENVDDVGFLDPILVVPLPVSAGEAQRYRIVDGEHRFEQQKLMDVPLLQCVIVDPERFPEVVQKKQTVRMNMIKGKLNPRKLAKLVTDLLEQHDVPYDEMAHELGFTDSDAFQKLLDSARDSLPNAGMKKEFDKSRDEIKTVDDLSMVLNRLFTKYGDTLPYNFMVLDFGGKEHLWIRLESKEYKKITERAKDCAAFGATFDSVLVHILTLLDPKSFIEKHRTFLKVPSVTTDTKKTVDDLFED